MLYFACKMAPGTMLLYLFAMMMTVTVVRCQCDDHDFTTPVDVCKSIHDALESALISPRNLYLLRKTFEPTSYHSPNVILIFYDVQFDSNETSRFEIGWSSSAVFSVIDPVSLSAFQSGMVMTFLTGLQLLPLDQNITLVLDVHNSLPTLPANSTELKSILNSLLKSVLKTLTTRLKAYATAQGKLTQWDGSDKGFIWERPETYENLVLLLIPIALITLLVLSVVILFTPTVKKRLARESGKKVFGILFWCMSLSVFTTLFLEVYLSIGFNYTSFVAYPRVRTFKLVVDLAPIGLGVLVGIGPSFWLGCSTPVPEAILPEILGNKSPCVGEAFNRKDYSLALVSYFIFITYITVRAFPTLMLAFLYPLEVISIIVTITAEAVVCPQLLLILVSTLLSCNGRIMGYGLLSSLVLVLVLWNNIFCMKVLRIGTNTSGVMQLLFSLITSFVMTMCGYLMKRVFLGKKSIFTLIKEDNQEDNTQEKDVSLTHTQTDNADPELQPLVVDGNVDTEP